MAAALSIIFWAAANIVFGLVKLAHFTAVRGLWASKVLYYQAETKVARLYARKGWL